MNRRAFVTGLGAVLAVPLAVGAQQAGRKIGYLSALAGPSPHPLRRRRSARDFANVDGSKGKTSRSGFALPRAMLSTSFRLRRSSSNGVSM